MAFDLKTLEHGVITCPSCKQGWPRCECHPYVVYTPFGCEECRNKGLIPGIERVNEFQWRLTEDAQ